MADESDPWGPKPGFYKARLVRNGIFVPVRIWWTGGDPDPETGDLTSDETLCGEIDGRRFDPNASDRHLFFDNITEAEYRFMVDDAAHAKAHRPNDAKTTPYESIDLNKMPTIF